MRRGTIDLLREDDPESLDLIEIDYSSIDRTRSPESLAKYERLLQTATNEFQRVSHRHTLLETLPRLADHRRDMERTLQATQMQLNHTLSLYQVKLADRTQRFRPFYAYLRNILPETYAQLYQNELAQTYILPERSEETGGGGHDDDVSIAEALSDGIVLDFIPPNRRYRRKSMWPLAEQLMAALAVMFTVYAFTRQPFVFVHQFDRLLDGIEPRLKELLVDFLVAQSNGRMQIVLASDRPEMFQRAGSVVGIVLKVSDLSGSGICVLLEQSAVKLILAILLFRVNTSRLLCISTTSESRIILLLILFCLNQKLNEYIDHQHGI